MRNATEPGLALHGGQPIRETPFPPWPNYQEQEVEAAVEVLRSGRLARQSGSKVREFEEAFAAKFGVHHALAVNSGTAAIHVALAALGVGPGMDVINTPHCFIGTATPVVHAGAVPNFADIDPHTFNLDPETIEPHLTAATRAIIPVHLNGCPADMDSILSLAARYDLHVIEDAAQAHGATYNGRLAGTMGDVGCFSFWEDKILTTAGEGGMVITNDPEVAERARRFHHHGELRQDGSYYQGERLYYHETLGYNYRMTEVQAAIGLIQLGRLDEYISLRRHNAHLLTRLLDDVPGVIPPYEPSNVEHAYYKYILKLDLEVLDVSVEQFVAALSAEGVPSSRRYPTPLHQQPLFVEGRGFADSKFPFSHHPGGVHYGAGLPVAEQLPSELVRVLMRPTFAPEDVEDIASAIGKVARHYRR